MVDEKKEITLNFIDDYRSFPQLWDQNNKLYTNKIKRHAGLQALATKYKMDIDGVKKKIKSLRSYFSKEHQKVIKKNNETGSEEPYHSLWFAYNHLSFIADSVTQREMGDTSYAYGEEPKSFEFATEDESNDSLATPAPEDEHEFFQPSRKKRNIYQSIKKEKEDEQEVEGYEVMKTAEEKTLNRDGCVIFGELIASKLRNLSRRNRILAERRICNIFYDLELEEIDNDPLNQI